MSSIRVTAFNYLNHEYYKLFSPDLENDSVIADPQPKKSVVFARKTFNIGFLARLSVVVINQLSEAFVYSILNRGIELFVLPFAQSREANPVTHSYRRFPDPLPSSDPVSL